jgi:hypothetical protein
MAYRYIDAMAKLPADAMLVGSEHSHQTQRYRCPDGRRFEVRMIDRMSDVWELTEIKETR